MPRSSGVCGGRSTRVPSLALRPSCRTAAPSERAAGGFAARAAGNGGGMVRGGAQIESDGLQARLQVRSWCDRTGLCERRRGDLLLAVTEAAANVVVHAYPDGRDGGFSLDLCQDAGAVVLEVSDEGVGPSGAAPSTGC